MCIALCWNVKLIYIIKLADSSGSVTSLQSKIQTKKSLPTQNTNPANSTTFWLYVFWVAFWDSTQFLPNMWRFPKNCWFFFLSSENSPNLRNKSPKLRKNLFRVKEQVDLGIQLLKIRRWRLTDFCPSDGSTRWSCVFSRKLQRYTGRNQNHGS